MNLSGEQRVPSTSRLELAATILLIAVTVLILGLTLWDRLHPGANQAVRVEPPVPSEPIAIGGAPIRGDRQARIALIEFSDFECPYCGRAAREILPAIDREYLSTGKAFLVWFNFPLAAHKHAEEAAEAAECVGRQGKFWDFHDWAFGHQDSLVAAHLLTAGEVLGLDPGRFTACLKGQATTKVRADTDLGTSMSVTGTPTWFVGVALTDGKVKIADRLTGARPVADFEKAIARVSGKL